MFVSNHNPLPETNLVSTRSQAEPKSFILHCALERFFGHNCPTTIGKIWVLAGILPRVKSITTLKFLQGPLLCHKLCFCWSWFGSIFILGKALNLSFFCCYSWTCTGQSLFALGTHTAALYPWKYHSSNLHWGFPLFWDCWEALAGSWVMTNNQKLHKLCTTRCQSRAHVELTPELRKL